MGHLRIEVMHFIAKDAAGNEYRLWAETPCNGEIREAATFKMKGGKVSHEGQGRYKLFINAEEIDVTSDDLRAP